MIPVRENSEVVIIYPDILPAFPFLPPLVAQVAAKALTWEMAPRTCNAKVAPKADSAAGGIWSKMKASARQRRQRCIQWGDGWEMDGDG